MADSIGKVGMNEASRHHDAQRVVVLDALHVTKVSRVNWRRQCIGTMSTLLAYLTHGVRFSPSFLRFLHHIFLNRLGQGGDRMYVQ